MAIRLIIAQLLQLLDEVGGDLCFKLNCDVLDLSEFVYFVDVLSAC